MTSSTAPLGNKDVNTSAESDQQNISLDAWREAAKSVNALDSLLDEYRRMSDSERNKGNFFEQLIRAYLQNDAQMSQQFARVYLWRDWPGGATKKDNGIDLVAVEHEDMPRDGSEPNADTPAVAIQCKFYDAGTRIAKEHLNSFLAESGKAPFKRRIFIETTGAQWSDNAEDTIRGQVIPVSRIGLTDLRNSDIDWTTYLPSKPEQRLDKQPRKSLRAHQVNAIRDVVDGLQENDRGVLVMACGTGKTFTSLKLAERFAEQNGGSLRMMFMVPSLALMSQTLQEWAAECEIPFAAWSVCSDTKVNRKRAEKDDLADIASVDLKTPPTTDPQKLADSLSEHVDNDGLQVVFATYQSIDIVHQAQQLAGSDWQDFDLIICDEAHRTTGVKLVGEDESAFTRVHSDDYIRADKRLYMTATPRIYQPNVKNLAKEKDAVLTSMDDEAVYGSVLHRLGFGEAVSQGLLTDYKVVVLAVPEDQMATRLQQSSGIELTLPDAAKLIGCWNALAKRKNGTVDSQYGNDNHPMRRAVAFAKDIKTSRQIKLDFPTLVNEGLLDLENDDDSDNLEVQCQHVDGGMNAIERGEALDWLKDGADSDHPVCRILTNARCLSEGVDVPTLDAVLFLNPRKSQVDVIQAVGRVMRKAEGKEFGYIILPVAVPAGITPEKALDDNERFKVVWQVLQAIRAHDERFDNTVNAIEYNHNAPENIMVEVVKLTKPQRDTSGDIGSDGGSGIGEENDPGIIQPQLPIFSSEDWKDAVYSELVKKVGNRLYWDDWSNDIADIARRYIGLIDSLLEEPQNQDAFKVFVDSLQATLNPAISAADAVEMLAQHLITKPLFDAMFPDQSFTSQNPVSRAMEGILDRLAKNDVFEREREPLANFYTTMTEKIRAIDNLAGKQDIMRTLYDRFFSKAFSNMQDRLGIVFTPVEVVDYILHSADYALQKHLGKSLSDRGVSVIEPFLGTGTFVTRLLQSGLIKDEDLPYKYANEIFANEIVLLSYYIASINIEQVYHQIRKEQGFDEEYQEFEGITLTDTFQLSEDTEQLAGLGDFQPNLDRVKRQRQAPIRVIVMNPPYSAKQRSANDNNQNLDYPTLDRRIEGTYKKLSTATSKSNLTDSYLRALRWASDRIGDEGVIAFVSNSSFIDSNSADGVRLTLLEEFSDIYIYNLRGGITGKIGESARREGGNVFDIKTGVAVTVLVKTRDHVGKARIHYVETLDNMAAQEKLDKLRSQISLAGTTFTDITPNEHGDWINQRDERFLEYQPLGDTNTKAKEETPGLFMNFSRGLETSRDAWCYNFSEAKVTQNMTRMIANYNAQVSSGTYDMDPTKIAWTRKLKKNGAANKKHAFDASHLRLSVYRPFCVQNVYYSSSMNEYVNQLPELFPTSSHPNVAFSVKQPASPKEFSLLAAVMLPDLNLIGSSTACQFFSLYTWQRDPALDGALDFSSLVTGGTDDADYSGRLDFTKPISQQIPEQIDGYRRVDNITDSTLADYREHYRDETAKRGEQITKEDIFFYVYALLHQPDYRERYEADLKKMLPRIPKVKDFWSYSLIGRELAELHVNYETIEPYPTVVEQWSEHAPVDNRARYRIHKPTWGKGDKGRANDLTRLVYNDYLTFAGIPVEANDYKIGGRSPLEWVLDRYKVTTHKDSGIVNDPNKYCEEINNPAYIAELIPRLVTVSMRTQELLNALPEFVVDEGN